MNEEEFITKFYSCDDEEQFLKDVYHNLNCLQQENQQLKEEYNKIQKAYESTFSDYQELKDNWNKLREWLESNWEESQDIWFVKIINKMQELERGNKFEK